MFWVVVTVRYLDAFISCMLVAPHTPAYSEWGKGIVGGREGSFNSFKKLNTYVSPHWDLYNPTHAGVLSLSRPSPSLDVVFKYCESTRMCLLVSKCFFLFFNFLFQPGCIPWWGREASFSFKNPAGEISSAGQSKNCSIWTLCNALSPDIYIESAWINAKLLTWNTAANHVIEKAILMQQLLEGHWDEVPRQKYS